MWFWKFPAFKLFCDLDEAYIVILYRFRKENTKYSRIGKGCKKRRKKIEKRY